MLSILIPTYNYNVYPLVMELKSQADELDLSYEILVQDDASKNFLEENTKINHLQHCSYTLNLENLGRGNNINLLNNRAQFDYVLIMEADAFPEKKTYLKDLITAINQETHVLFGGVSYPKIKPEQANLLRWKYGNERESISLKNRIKNPYHFVFTWNLLVKKDILTQFPFPNNITSYGYEDVVFIKQLKENNIIIQHIENKLIHFNSESSVTFIHKTEIALQTLHQLIQNQKLSSNDTKIGKVSKLFQVLHLQNLVCYIFSKISKKCIANLTSSNPSLLILDFYKLVYFLNIK